MCSEQINAWNSNFMRALLLRSPGSAAIAEIPVPARNPGEALLRVEYVGLCGTDLNSYRGRNPLVSYPRIPGHEISATIVEIDEGQEGLTVGSTVTLSPYTNCGVCASCRNNRSNACQFNQTLGVQRDGALTEYISVPVQKLYRASLSLKELCLVEPLTVGCHAIARARVALADVVAIFGCGGVGLGAVAASAFRGAKTIAIDVDDAKLEIAKKTGADHAINSKRDDLGAAIKELTEGFGPQVVVEAVGHPETFRTAVDLVAFTGRVVYIGYAKEPVAYETRFFVQKELDIMGSRNALPCDFEEVISMLEQGRFPVEAVVSTIVELDAAPAILAAWDADPQRYTKILISLQ
jgi:threonine dehydrogenase-like Zn-dependent dehydrogenase